MPIVTHVDINTDDLIEKHWVDENDTSMYHQKLLRKEFIPFQSYSHVHTKRSSPMVNHWWSQYGTNNPMSKPTNGITTSAIDIGVDSWSEDLEALADLKAIAKLNEKVSQSQFNLGVTLLEFNKTVGLVTSSASRIYDCYRNLRKGNLGKAIDALSLSRNHHLPELRRIQSKERDIYKRVASQWLELRYGWRPLLGDVHNSMEALANRLYSTPWDISVRCGASETYSHDFDTTISVGARKGYITRSAQCEITKRYVRLLRVIPDSYRNVNSLGLTNPGLVAWEVVPFSFVVDWFLPVGTWLAAASRPAGASAYTGTHSTRIKRWRKRTHNGPYRFSFPYYYGVDNSSDIFEEDTYVRSVGGYWPSPSFPTIQNAKWTPTRALDAISLLTTLLPK